MLDLSNISIEKVIAHSVYRRGADGSLRHPNLSNNIFELSQQESSVMQERLISALGSSNKSVYMDIVRDDQSSTIHLLKSVFGATPEIFAASSRQIANKLAEAQTNRNIPDCALFILSGQTGENNRRYVAVLKSESQSAFHLTHGEDHVSVLELIENALLGKDHKLYKIAFMVESAHQTAPPQYEVIVFDSNLDFDATRKASIYFFDAFLGCTIQRNSKILTKEFYDKTSEYILNLNINANEKKILQTSLATYLCAPGIPLISPNGFASTFFEDQNIQVDYVEKMAENNIPNIAIAKDISAIKRRLQRRILVFSSGVTISGKHDEFDDVVRIVEENANGCLVSIAGCLEKQK